MAKTDVYMFEEGKHRPQEQWERPGKPEWPSILVLTMHQSRERALDLAIDILRQLRDEPDKEVPIILHLVGEMKQSGRRRCPWTFIPGVLVPPGTEPKERQRCTFDEGHAGKCSWDGQTPKEEADEPIRTSNQ